MTPLSGLLFGIVLGSLGTLGALAIGIYCRGEPSRTVFDPETELNPVYPMRNYEDPEPEDLDASQLPWGTP